MREEQDRIPANIVVKEDITCLDQYVVIVAGGSGKRMRSDIPKQFLMLAGKPVLMHTIIRFSTYCSSIKIIVVLPSDQMEHWNDLLREYSFRVPHTVTEGGPSRFHSVRNGLNMIPGSGLVAIHDGVRPLVTTATIKRCFEAASSFGSAIPVTSPSDSIRIITGMESVTVDRKHIKQVQTPQVFRTALIKKAYLQEFLPDFTDDATVFEKSGEKIALVEGNRENIKITNPEDLTLAETLLAFIS